MARRTLPRADWPDTEDLRPHPLDLDAAVERWGADLATGAAAGSPT
ncbi:hypothetical protein [Nocardia sp. NPDC002869]